MVWRSPLVYFGHVGFYIIYRGVSNHYHIIASEVGHFVQDFIYCGGSFRAGFYLLRWVISCSILFIKLDRFV